MTRAKKGVPDFRLTDSGNAHRFVAQHGASVRFVPAWKKWLAWQDDRWFVDDTLAIERLARETAVQIWDEVKAAQGSDTKKDLVAHAMRSESAKGIRNMLEISKSDAAIVVRPSELDRNEMLLGVRNGVVDLQNGEFRQSARADLITKTCGTHFDPDAKCPGWQGFLDRVQPDPAMREYLQRAVGYSLTARISEQALFILHGKGANGKTVCVATIGNLLGDYAAAADFGTFLERRSDGPRSDLARLRGMRFVAAHESNEGRSFNEAVIKQLTGGDKIVARALYQEEQEFVLQAKIFLSSNHKPQLRGTDYALWRRIQLIPFEVTIPEAERDPLLLSALANELPGILNWAIAGCAAWLETGLRPPAAVTAATEEYRTESDILGAFISERCDVDDPQVVTSAAALYDDFKTWAIARGERVMSNTAFGSKLSDRGIGKVKSGTVVRVGIRLVPQRLSELSTAGLTRPDARRNGQTGQLDVGFTNSSRARAYEEVPE